MTYFGLLRESGCTIPSYSVPDGQERPEIVKIWTGAIVSEF